MNARLRDPEWREAFAHSSPGGWPLLLDAVAEPALRWPDPAPSHDPESLHADAITIRVGGTSLLGGVSLRLQPGEVGAVLGPNGAGKSTLLSVLAGLRLPDEGQVVLGGRPLPSLATATLALERAVLPQDSGVAFDFSVRDVVELGRYPHRLAPARNEAGIVQEAMSLTGVGHLAERALNSLSGGERARAQLARVLAQIWHPLPDGRPRWLLLDEPTAALDLRHQHGTMATVRRWAREQGVGVVAVLHDPNLALRYADQVCVLDGGLVQASGAPEQTLTPHLLQRVWGVRSRSVVDVDGSTQLLIAPDV